GEGNEIFHTAIGTFCKFELKRKVKCAVLVGGNNVAPIGRFAAAGRQHGQGAVFDFPPLCWERIFVSTYPTSVTFAIEEQFVTTPLLIRRQAVRCEVDRIDARREFLRLKVLGLYTDVFKIHLLPGEGLVANAVHLQPDESGRVERIDYIGHGCTVYPGFGFIADGFDAYVVKFSFFIGRFGLLVKVEWIEPSTAGLVVNSPCPCTFA